MNSVLRPVLLAVVAFMFLCRAIVPTDLFEGEQWRQVGYAMDLLHGGDWAVQYEVDGNVSTKPPLYTWLSAGFAKLFGSTEPWVMKLPSFVASAGLLYFTYRIGLRLFDEQVAFWSVVASVSTYQFSKLALWARTDMLMTVLLYAAIYAVYRLPPRWYKAPIIGVLLGAGVLAKGPVGPILFALWLALFGLDTGTFRVGRSYAMVAVGASITAVIGGSWLFAAWTRPEFYDVAIAQQTLGRLNGTVDPSKSFYFYVVPYLLQIAPWSWVAIAAVFVSRGDPKWKDARFVALWALLFFVFFSLFPSKRADRLLPMFPAVFLLAGVGITQLLKPPVHTVFKRVLQAVAIILVVGTFVLPGMADSRSLVPTMYGYAGVMALCGFAAFGFVWVNIPRYAGVCIAVGLVAAHAMFHHELLNYEEGSRYPALRAALAPAKADGPGRVFVWNAFPLASYELGVHRRGVSLAGFQPEEFDWFVTSETPERLETFLAENRLRETARVPTDNVTYNDVYVYRVEPASDP